MAGRYFIENENSEWRTFRTKIIFVWWIIISFNFEQFRNERKKIFYKANSAKKLLHLLESMRRQLLKLSKITFAPLGFLNHFHVRVLFISIYFVLVNNLFYFLLTECAIFSFYRELSLLYSCYWHLSTDMNKFMHFSCFIKKYISKWSLF